MNDLELFRDKVLYVRSATEDDDLPKASTLESFIYQQLKHHPKMTTTIDQYESSNLGSHRRSYEWLWNRMEDVITSHKLMLTQPSSIKR